LTAVINIAVADHALQNAKRTLMIRLTPNLLGGPLTNAWSQVAMSVTASGGKTPCMTVICRSTMLRSAIRP